MWIILDGLYWQREDALKSAPQLFQMKIWSTFSSQKLWRSRWLQECHSCLEWQPSPLPLLKSKSGWLNSSQETYLLEYEEQASWKHQRPRSKSWRGSLVRTSWLKSEFVQAEAWMCHTVMGNIPESGPLQPDCRDWCTATILGTSFWVWFDLWRFPWETVSKSSILLEVLLKASFQ